MQLVERLKLIGADPADDEDLRARKALLVLISVLILPVAAMWGALYLSFGSPVGVVPLVYFAVLAGGIVVFARTRNFPWLLRLGQVAILFAPTLSMIPLGGFLGRRRRRALGDPRSARSARVRHGSRLRSAGTSAFAIVFLGSGIAGELVGPVSPQVPRWFTTTMLGAEHHRRRRDRVHAARRVRRRAPRRAGALRVEQAKAEELLLNILPSSIAERLKAQTRPIADHFGSASILFADVVDFTPWSERLQPEEVVGHLDLLFTHFDGLAERVRAREDQDDRRLLHGRCGCPDPAARPCARARARRRSTCSTRCASTRSSPQLGLELRIGINSGPVVAGVIGRKRFLYDLWGDAVNTASRMESHGAPGRIQITRATYELLADEFECEPRGTIVVKGKGEIEAWYLVGPSVRSRSS